MTNDQLNEIKSQVVAMIGASRELGVTSARQGCPALERLQKEKLNDLFMAFSAYLNGIPTDRQLQPLTLEQVYEIEAQSVVPSRQPEYTTDSWGDEKTIWHETKVFSFPLFARNIERAHGIGEPPCEQPS